MMVSKQGPVRAIRGYVGANSGPTTYRTHKFYDSREDVVTTLRVHPTTAGIMDFFDYSPAAAGMIYRNDLNPAGVVIDGSTDRITPGQMQWEMVTGPQGTMAMAHIVHTDIPGFKYTTYYQDAAPAPNAQCSGDSAEYGASGEREPLAPGGGRFQPGGLRTRGQGPRDGGARAARSRPARDPAQHRGSRRGNLLRARPARRPR